MKKIRIKRFLSLDFVNSDLSKVETIKGLIKSFIRAVGGHPSASRWEAELLKKIAEFKELQRLMIRFIEFSIEEFQGGNLIGEEFNNTKDFISNESSKFKLYDDPLRSYRHAMLDPKTDIVKEFIIPGLCYDFTECKTYLNKHRYWDRIKRCSECCRFFVSKTHRYTLYCSKKCRDKNRQRKKIESGEWRKYVKEWRTRRSKNM